MIPDKLVLLSISIKKQIVDTPLSYGIEFDPVYFKTWSKALSISAVGWSCVFFSSWASGFKSASIPRVRNACIGSA